MALFEEPLGDGRGWQIQSHRNKAWEFWAGFAICLSLLISVQHCIKTAVKDSHGHSLFFPRRDGLIPAEMYLPEVVSISYCITSNDQS